GQKPASAPIALIHQADGTFTVVRQQETDWIFGNVAQLAWWPGGTGIIDVEAVQPGGSVDADIFRISFLPAGPHWGGGTFHDDLLAGTSGEDEIAGFGGDDTIAGGAGFDTAVFQGPRADYDIALQGPSGGLVVDSAAEGTDTLSGVEFLRFSDTTVSVL